MSLDPKGLAGGDVNLYRYVLNDPVNRTDPYGLDSYRTNAGHGYLVIDDPSGSGGIYVFNQGPQSQSLTNLAKMLIGMSVPAYAGVQYFGPNDSKPFLGVEVPFSRISQDALADQATIHRAQDFVEKTEKGETSYNLYNVGPTKGRYWRTVPINSSLRNLILDLKQDLKLVNSGFVLPRSKDWDNGDQAVPLKAFLRSIKIKPIKFHALRACFATQMLANGVSAPIVMKIGGWKKSATMDIYLRLAGVDTKGATDCLHFVPEDISFGDNVVNIFNQRKDA